MTHKLQQAQPKKRTERTMVMMELPYMEHSRSDTHHAAFLKFLCELGFDAKYEHDCAGLETHLIINGVSVRADYKKAASNGRNAWTRETTPRKERSISLIIGGHNGKTIHIYANKEIDKLHLVDRITTGLNQLKEVVYTMEAKHTHRIQFMTDLINRYRNTPHFRSVQSTDGILQISTANGTLQFDAKGDAIGLTVNMAEINTWLDLNELPKKAQEVYDGIYESKNYVKKLGPTGIDATSPQGSAWLYENKIQIT